MTKTYTQAEVDQIIATTKRETVEEFVRLSHQEWPNGGNELEEIEWIAAHHFGVILTNDQLADKQEV